MTDDFAAAAQATAEWWASKVFGDSIAPVTTPDDPMGGPAFALQFLLRETRPAPADKRAEYVEAVAQWVESQLRMQSESFRSPYVSILTDYGAPFEFQGINDRLGISGARYPSKSVTRTDLDHVVAEFGYHGQPQIVWHAEGWTPPPCGQGAWDLTSPRGGRLPWKCSAPKYHPHNQHVMDVPDPLCVAPSKYPGRETCNESENDYHHTSTDDYMSRWVHDFVPGEVKPMTPRQRKAVNA